MLRRDGARVRCFTRNGHDWADRFPAIVDAALRIKAASFLVDGEAVIVRAALTGQRTHSRCRWSATRGGANLRAQRRDDHGVDLWRDAALTGIRHGASVHWCVGDFISTREE
jgi:hypothetical protein